MSLAPGSRVGPYEILAPLGAGGMGEVWKARDTRLDRTVALKFSKDRFSERFEHEARAIAALNHPNVAQVYDVGDRYIVMEYVDGAPVHSAGGDIRRVLDAAVQIADGLAAAHAAGFVHRDLKPANILITRSGKVKILDFGLAKRTAAAETVADQTETMLSIPGAVMGTAAYMSPEQARGLSLDLRSDQFSFGLVIYEMLTGRRAFDRASAAETMTAIIRDEVEALPSSTPAALRWTVGRCLAKDPSQRYDSTGDLYRELCQIRDHWSEAVSGAQSVASPAPARTRAKKMLPIAVAAVLLIAASAATARWFMNRKPDVPQWIGRRLAGPGIAMRPAISPDGKLLAFSAMVDNQTQLAVMQPDSQSWTVLTYDHNAGTQAEMSWSPDGSRIYFDRVWGGPRGVYSISPLGGESRLVLEAAQCPRALPDGTLILVRIDEHARYRLYRLWPDSGKLQSLPALVGGGEIQVVDPLFQVFPDGRELVYLGTPASQPDGVARWYVMNLETLSSKPLNSPVVRGAFSVGVTPDNQSVLLVSAIGDEWTIAAVPRAGTAAPRDLISFPRPHNIYGIDAAHDGSVYFDYMMRQSALLRFDSSAKLLSETVATLDGSAAVPLDAGSLLAESAEAGKAKLKVFSPATGSRNLLESPEESSSPAARVGAGSVVFLAGPRDARRIAIATLSEGRIVKRFSFDASSITSIVATPDGARLYFCDRGQVWWIDTNANESAKPAAMTPGDSVAVDRAGKYLYVKRTENGRRELLRLPMSGGAAEPLTIPPEYTISGDLLSPAAVDASGRILFEVDSADSWYERIAMIDPSRKTFTLFPAAFSGDLWGPGWDSDGNIEAIGVHVDSTLWRYKPSGR